MTYTATDGFQSLTTAALPVGSITLPLAATGTLCSSSAQAPAWVTIKSSAGYEAVKVSGCTNGVPSITATTIAHPTGACVMGYTIPAQLIYEILQAAGYISNCTELTVV